MLRFPSSGDGGKRSANLATGSPAARPLAKVVKVSLSSHTKNLAARLFTRRWTGLLPLPPAPLRGERAASNWGAGRARFGSGP